VTTLVVHAKATKVATTDKITLKNYTKKKLKFNR